MKFLLLIKGSPSSGKTTISRLISKKFDDVRIINQDTVMTKLGGIKADSEKVFNKMLVQLNNLIKKKRNVIIEGTLSTKRNGKYLIDNLLNEGKKANYNTVIIHLDSSLKTTMKRWKKRCEDWENNSYYTGNLKDWHRDAKESIREKDIVINTDNKKPEEISKIIIDKHLN